MRLGERLMPANKRSWWQAINGHCLGNQASIQVQPNAQLVSVVAATGRFMPRPLAEPAPIEIYSSGVKTNNQPLTTLNVSGQMTVLVPPSAEALRPHVPAAPLVAPVITEAALVIASLAGVADTSVGNAVT